jgi:hypothetical protein
MQEVQRTQQIFEREIEHSNELPISTNLQKGLKEEGKGKAKASSQGKKK